MISTDELRDFYTWVAHSRERWIARNQYFHTSVAKLLRGRVGEGQRVLEIGCGLGDTLAAMHPSRGVGIDLSAEMVKRARERHPDLEFREADAHELDLGEQFDVVILNDTVMDLEDILTALRAAHHHLVPGGRLLATHYNYLWEPILKGAEKLRLRQPHRLQNWITPYDLKNFLTLADFEVEDSGAGLLLPKAWPGADWINRHLAPLLPGLALVRWAEARSAPPLEERALRCSVVVPCRDEADNVPQIVARVPSLGAGTELIFVDGASTDGTSERIREEMERYEGPNTIKLIKQDPDLGKGDAVRKGFAEATGDLHIILDADLTVPPEDLPTFVRVMAQGRARFANGTRLVYQLEDESMRLLNIMANRFFSWVFTWLLGRPIRDTLCGTKVWFAEDWPRLLEARQVFGNFDPFGDFDLLFGAAWLDLELREVPVRYQRRAFGDTKIHRFRHGLLLVRMTWEGFKRLKWRRPPTEPLR